ncbi:MAG: outer membrane protein assembly factor [Myxococcales bacterium]|nr:outer membrane protein assembly factor [Myxococcales bacterium]
MWLLLVACLVSAHAADPAARPWDRVGWGFGALPAVNFNSDEGAGFGAVGSLYRYDGETGPYKTGITLILFATTKGVQNHSLLVDTLRVGGSPLRLQVRGALTTALADNYCGIGNAVTCDPAIPEALVTEGLDDEAAQTFVRRFYRTRYVAPSLRLDARYALDPMPHRLELVAGWRAQYHLPGTFRERGPWPGSLYEQDFVAGQQGLVSVLQLGLMLDDRDNEPAPTRGYWVEASVRGASRFWGSDWSYVGVNTTLRGYLPLGSERLVLADRLVFDLRAGDAPILELATPGGFQRYTGYGSLNAGRGIRQRRYIGRVLAMEQAELRWLALPLTVAKVPVDIGLIGFGDLAFVGAEVSDVRTMWQRPLLGTGAGVRLSFDKNFIVRADVGVSAIEDWAPSVYIDLRNLF